MSYQVLARKWRPNTFAELVGQEHVVAAISNALDNNRLHHAYLFTGTRGVGKTTIARIFSKSLNCETGMGSTPCGVCPTCREIEQGNYVDLLEIDAASRTKVEDTRELLDNVQYKPTRGEYKVYLIDEVHMLSKHSFNALLKTLEEPPPHVKFLLATTDPQKLPVTILSRCLQFNLKALSRNQISQQLQHILQQESVANEPEALAQLARAAQGSMRDALSLTDQAIAQGNGQVTKQVVTDMLGLMDKGQILKLVHGVLQKDSAAVMEQVEALSFQAPDYNQVLAEIMSLLHQVALTQFVPDACKLETTSARAIYQLAKSVPAEQVQLMYQIALQGKKDLPYAADGRSGLEMCLLRMLAFHPVAIELNVDSFEQLAEQQSAPVMPQAAPEPVAPQVTPPVAPEPAVQPSVQSPAPTVEPDEPEEAEQDNHQDFVAQQSQLMEQAESQHPNWQSQPPEPPPFDLPIQDTPPLEQPDDFTALPADFEQSGAPIDTPNQGMPHEQGQPQPTDAGSQPQDVASKTASLLALKEKLQQTPVGEEEPEPDVKKSETDSGDNIGSLLAAAAKAKADTPVPESSEQVNDTSKPDESPQVIEPEAVESAEQAFSASVPPSDVPPWDESLDMPTPVAEAQTETQVQPEPVLETPPSAPIFDEPTQGFDPNAHLEESVDVEVDFEVPAFLPSGEKVVAAKQLDTWSQLIEQMQVTALTKQLALHSSYRKQDNQVHLTLLSSKEHLNTESARQQLQSALSEALQQDIELMIDLEQPINTPFAVQQSINQVRQTHAKQVVDSDETIVSLRDTFAASVVEQSIKPR